jgi:hypothetical protein
LIHRRYATIQLAYLLEITENLRGNMMKSRICAGLIAGGFSLTLIGCGAGGEDAPPTAPSQAEAKAALEKSGATDSGSTTPGVVKKKSGRKSAGENTPAKAD